MRVARKASAAGILLGASLFTFAPSIGGLLTVLLLIRAFSTVAGVAPELKAAVLAAAISEAMNCTAGGVALGVMGLAVSLVSLALFARKSQGTALPQAR